MRALVWMAGLAGFLACTASAYLLVPFPGALEVAASDGAPTSDGLSDGATNPAQAELDRAFFDLEGKIRELLTRVESTLGELDLGNFQELLRNQEMMGRSYEAIISNDLRAELDRLLRGASSLDFLVFVSTDGNTLAANVSEPLTGTPLKRVQEVARPLLRARAHRSGVESLPEFLRSGDSGRSHPSVYVPYEFIISSRVVWARSDVPAGVLIGGVDIARLREILATSDRERGFARTQLLSPSDKGGFVVVHGEAIGERHDLRPEFLGELEVDGVVHSHPFRPDKTPGAWSGLRGSDGRLAFVWGVTSPRSLESGPPGDDVARSSSTAVTTWDFLASRDFLIAAGFALAALCLVWIFLRTWRRRDERAWSGFGGLDSLAARGQTSALSEIDGDGDVADLARRIELLSSEMRRLLGDDLAQKTRDLESSMGIELAKLRDEVEGVRRGIANQREDLLTALDRREESADEAPVGITRDLDGFRTALETKLDSFAESLQSVAQRTAEGAAAPVVEAWKAQADGFRGEIDEARKIAETLLADLEAARTTEVELRRELEDIRRRERDLTDRLAEEVSSRGESSIREDELVARIAELEEAEGRTRVELARLGTSSVANDQNGTHEELAQRIATLERELVEMRTVASSEGERATSLEAESASLREERDRLKEELSLDRAALEGAESSLRETERLGEKLIELERVMAELESEAGTLRRENEELQTSLARVREEDASSTESSPAAELVASGEELERLRAELESMQDFQGALVQGNLPVAMLALDPDLEIFVWNPAAEHLFRVSSSDALGAPLAGISRIAPELLAKLAEVAKRTIESGARYEHERERFVLDGRAAWLELRAEPILSSNRGDSPVASTPAEAPATAEEKAPLERLGAIISVRDVTQLVELQKELEVQDAFLDGLTRSIPVALVVTDKDHRVIVWNRNAERILKVAEEEALGANLLSLPCRLLESSFREDFAAAARAGKATRFQVSADTDEIQARYLVTFSPFRKSDGELRGHLLLIERAAHTKIVSRQE